MRWTVAFDALERAGWPASPACPLTWRASASPGRVSAAWPRSAGLARATSTTQARSPPPMPRGLPLPGASASAAPRPPSRYLRCARLDGVGVDAEPRGYGCRGLAAGLRQQHARPVDAPCHLRPRPRDPLELLAVTLGELQACGGRSHGMPLPLSPAFVPLSHRKGYETHYL